MASQKQTKKRPAEASSTAGSRMFLRVKSQDGTVIHFEVSRETRFQRIFRYYCEKKNVDHRTVNFLYEGKRIRANTTPNDLQMENDEEIDCVVLHDGGGFC